MTVFPSDPQNDGVNWLPYILINTRLLSKSRAVLLHELIHAAYGEFPPLPRGGVHDPDLNSVFHDCDLDSTQDGLTQLRMPPQHIDPLKRAYFTNYTA